MQSPGDHYPGVRGQLVKPCRSFYERQPKSLTRTPVRPWWAIFFGVESKLLIEVPGSRSWVIESECFHLQGAGIGDEAPQRLHNQLLPNPLTSNVGRHDQPTDDVTRVVRREKESTQERCSRRTTCDADAECCRTRQIP